MIHLPFDPHIRYNTMKKDKNIITWRISQYDKGSYPEHRGGVGLVNVFLIFRQSGEIKEQKYGMRVLNEEETYYFPTLKDAKEWANKKIILLMLKKENRWLSKYFGSL